jgi:hypothetical protein
MYSDAPAVECRPDPAPTFAPTNVRYVKLGAGGAWSKWAFTEGVIPIGFEEVPRELCDAGDWNRARGQLVDAGYAGSTATNWIRELKDFYTLGEDCLWFTIADGHLHWAFSAPEVCAPDHEMGGAQRIRRVIGGWRRTDLRGEALTTRSLSSALLRTAGYRMTICKVEREDYLIRRIRGDQDPLHVEALLLKAQLRSLADAMIRQLDWRDFEVLVELVLSRGGWQRTSALGSGEVDLDLLLTQPTTGEIAWVQIKSSASQATLDDYVARYERDGSCQRFYFICHTSKAALSLPARPGYHLWTGAALAEAVVNAGLFDWLTERTK